MVEPIELPAFRKSYPMRGREPGPDHMIWSPPPGRAQTVAPVRWRDW